jgi:hypothetical protein
MRLREADCRRGRTRFEGGRYRRDGSPATESVRSTRRGDTTMRMSDNPALRDYDDYYIGSILRGEGTAFLLDQGILFAGTTLSMKKLRVRAKSTIGWALISTE